jgi:hypothetical protein
MMSSREMRILPKMARMDAGIGPGVGFFLVGRFFSANHALL